MTREDNEMASIFDVPEDYRAALEKIAKANVSNSDKQSIDSCIIHALESYFKIPTDCQTKPSLPDLPLRAFTVKTTSGLRQKINESAANWQLKTSIPVSINAVVNTAILIFIQNHTNLK